MYTVKAPPQYRNEIGIIENSAEIVAAVGKRAYILGSKTALSKIKPHLIDKLNHVGVAYESGLFAGQCTLDEIDGYSELAGQFKADFIIGVGGGKALDTAKAIGDKIELPVVTIPTVAATCAAWAALTVLYDAEGRAVGYLPLKRSPVLTLADTRILASAPKKYLAAGIADTLVKWYEVSINASGKPGELDVLIGSQIAKLALEVIRKNALQALEAAGSGVVTRAFSEMTDAIIMLAGLVGSVAGITPRAAISHAIHDSLTQLQGTHGTLHGEKVAFGLLTQVILEERSDVEVEELATLLHTLRLPLTLEALGLKGDVSGYATQIADGVRLTEEAVQALHFQVNTRTLALSIEKADLVARKLLPKVVG